MANTPQTYTVKFRSLTPEKLAAIIVNEGDYHEDAVKAARLELTARMLPAEELDRVYDLAETQKINSGSDGMKIGFGKNAKVEAVKNSFKDKVKSSIWGRTNILKLIAGYLFFSLGLSLYNVISSFSNLPPYGGFEIYTRHVAQLIDPAILAITIGLGLKGYKAAWWITLILFAFISVFGILNMQLTYQYYYAFDEETSGLSGLILMLTDDPLSSVLRILLPLLFLYLLLRKDTRVACGVAKGEEIAIDELDHLI